MTYETTISRIMRGDLQANTTIALGYDRRELRISTGKAWKGISCSAHVVQVSEDGRTFSFAFQDFNKQLANDLKLRCTEKNLRAMHAKTLLGIDDVLAAAKAKHPQAATTETPIEAIRLDLGALDELPEERWSRTDPKLSSAEEADEAMSDFNCRASPMHY